MIDRDDQFRFWARGLFKQQGVSEILSTPSPADARELVLRHDIHVALLEIGLEEPGWLAFLTWLRDRRGSPCPYLPVLLMAKTIDMEMMRLACGLGVHGLLRKPMSGDAVLKGVSSVLINPRKLGWSGDGDQPADGGGGSAPPQPPRAPVPPRPVAVGASSGVLPRVAVEIGEAKAAAPRRAGVGAAGPGARPLPGSGTRGGFDDDAAPAEKPKIAIELIEVETFAKPAAVEDDEGWGEAAAARKPRRRGDDDDDRGFEPPPAKAVKPVAAAAAGLDVGQMLQDHALWVQSAATQGKRAALEGEDLSSQSFVEAQLNNAMLRRCDLSGSDCTGAQMQGADLRHAEFIGCTLIDSNLALARLRHATFRGCRFDRANLKGADLAGADLREAKLGDADLAGANLLEVRLAGADLSGVAGLTQAQLESAVGDSKTRLPPGLYLPAARRS
ncbi:MAG TPA: pentapeptide repeat-containing protein [Patescibacteria group bacterium]|nr:pentapeptide repeat-containing protein [Patescibacteria group bacterium]